MDWLTLGIALFKGLTKLADLYEREKDRQAGRNEVQNEELSKSNTALVTASKVDACISAMSDSDVINSLRQFQRDK